MPRSSMLMLVWFTSALRTKYKPGFGWVNLMSGVLASGPFCHESNAWRSVASIAFASKSPVMPKMMLLGCTYCWCQFRSDGGRLGLRSFLPRIECLAQRGFHRFRVEVAGDAEDDVVGMHVLLVPV